MAKILSFKVDFNPILQIGVIDVGEMENVCGEGEMRCSRLHVRLKLVGVASHPI